ncbi:MAG: condensation domain-containing protein, partial [Acidobacteria bacterium]|nr:condensation domain-containing protein [Acidobacteriota bacterium]
MKKEGVGAERQERIARRERSDFCPLSFAQQRLWFLDQLEPGAAAYNVTAALRLKGRLDADALRRALDEVVRRHESLRTTFAEADGQPVQLIAPELTVSLPVVDLAHRAGDERGVEVGRLAAEEARAGFDLRQGPLLRARLLRLTEAEHVLLFTMHHIISDGWSVGVLVREVAALYEAFARGGPSPLAELPVQYADYAAWQRARLTGGVLEEQLSYWRRQLAGAPPVLSLPTDRPRLPARSARGALQRFNIPEPVTRELEALSRREGCTLYMTLLAAFQTLLHRYTGEDDILVGSPVAGRG